MLVGRHATAQMSDVTDGFGICADKIRGASRCTRLKILCTKRYGSKTKKTFESLSDFLVNQDCSFAFSADKQCKVSCQCDDNALILAFRPG